MTAIKCVVWDLDQTLWRGIMIEGDRLEVRPEVPRVLAELDRRGILHSISSRNDADAALAALKTLGLADYFLVPQINWTAKSSHLLAISKELDLTLNSLAFIDDDAFERAEVASALPEVTCYPPEAINTLDRLPEFSPVQVTTEAASRRQLYQTELRRRAAQDSSGRPQDSFLASLNTVMHVRRATVEDITRAQELTVRTHQLNTTGITFARDELISLIDSLDHEVLVASMHDRFGSYGTIGLAVVRTMSCEWRLRLLLTSCRVKPRGAGSILLYEVMARARRCGARIQAEMIPTDRNRMMLISLRFAGFSLMPPPPGAAENVLFFQADTGQVPPFPSHVTVISDDLPSQ